ncbi:ComEA family DNA-binding protein [Salegentibacter chungangensis]|uniref:ComEA family DNA-binding protein n=1 Tax=Salegentibacter chungangensis TaxID=1335724 RepID=A0ABW3NQD7_9FLAO
MVVIIIILQLIYFFADFSGNKDAHFYDREETERLQKKLDSIKQMQASEDSLKIYPFNPNFITDFKGYSLGMSIEEIDRLHEYRAQDKWVNSAEDFQKVTGISDSLLLRISPYFKFPEWVNKTNPSVKTFPSVSKKREVRELSDLNTASEEALIEIDGVGEVLSQRILNYRNKIGGFRDMIQLKDVWGLNAELRGKIEQRFRIEENLEWHKAGINSISVLALAEIPYFNYELAREIIDYRSLRGRIQSFEELSKIKDFPSDKIDRIKLYLTVD